MGGFNDPNMNISAFIMALVLAEAKLSTRYSAQRAFGRRETRGSDQQGERAQDASDAQAVGSGAVLGLAITWGRGHNPLQVTHCTYPSLTVRLFVRRYAESVAEALSLPPAQRHAAWSDMLCVADVLATFALQDDDGGTAGGTGTSGASVLLTLTGSFGEEDAAPWQQAMQAHLARLLVAGVSNGFIRQQQWLGALARVAAWRVECPQLAAALAWATVHDTQLFGRGEGLREALRHWLPLAGGRVEDGAALRAATLLGGVRAAAGSGGGRPRGRNVELPGIGSIGETRLVACLEEGQRMKLPGLPPGPEAWGDAVAARLGLASAATATAAGEAAGLTGARYLDPEEWVRAATAAAAMASVTA